MKFEQTGAVPRDALQTLSNAILQELLEQEIEKTADEMDVELIREITAVLDARNGNSIDVDEKYTEFITEYLGEEMLYPAEDVEDGKKPLPIHRRKRLSRLAVLAAVLVVLFAVTAEASGVDLLKAFGRWSQETFEFDVAADVPDNEGDDRLAALKYALNKDGITTALVPEYLPEGYEFERLDAGRGEYCAVYLKGENALLIQIHSTQSGNASRLEKNEGDPDVYIAGGIEHHIVANLELYSATWVNDGYECTIYGIPTLDETYQMIDSIYGED